MGLLEGLFNYAENKRLVTEDTAADLYQVREHDGEIWITYNGNLICPASMLNIEPVEALKQMRELYVKRNT